MSSVTLSLFRYLNSGSYSSTSAYRLFSNSSFEIFFVMSIRTSLGLASVKCSHPAYRPLQKSLILEMLGF